MLSRRALNRATLARQLLLERSERTPAGALEHLVGLQAQVPRDPYTALWSRLRDFRPEALSELVATRQAVRLALMRSTIHLVLASDALRIRPLVQPVLEAELARHAEYGPPLRELDLGPVLVFARELFAEKPRTGPELRAALATRFPEANAAALAYACRNHLALVQVPPRGVWGRTAQVRTTTVEAWLGQPLERSPSLDDLALRYLGAFGPATVADAAAWSRLTGLREVFERLRPHLCRFRDEDGRELFDLPDAPRPEPETPAAPRFLPEYDNLLLSHADRSRFYVDRDRFAAVAGPVRGSMLADGVVCGIWRIERDRGSGRATLVVELVVNLTERTRAAVEAEGRRLLRFAAADASAHEVQLVAVP